MKKPSVSPVETGEQLDRRGFLRDLVQKGTALGAMALGIRADTSAKSQMAIEPDPTSAKESVATAAKSASAAHENINKEELLVLDGIDFAIRPAKNKEMFAAAYERAKAKVGGPYWKPEKPWTIEIAEGEHGMSFTNYPDSKITSFAGPLEHEIIHFLLGVNSDSKKWSPVLGEFFAHSASPKRSQIQYDPAALNHPSLSMRDDAIAVSTEHSFFSDMRNQAAINASKALLPDVRKRMAAEAVEKNIPFEEVAGFLAKFGVKDAVFQKAAPGIKKGVFIGKADGAIWITPLFYNTAQDGAESQLPVEFTLEMTTKDGKKYAPKVFLAPRFSGTPGKLMDLLTFVSRENGVVLPLVTEIITVHIPETGQTVNLSELKD